MHGVKYVGIGFLDQAQVGPGEREGDGGDDAGIVHLGDEVFCSDHTGTRVAIQFVEPRIAGTIVFTVMADIWWENMGMKVDGHNDTLSRTSAAKAQKKKQRTRSSK